LKQSPVQSQASSGSPSRDVQNNGRAGYAYDPRSRQKKPGAENVTVCCRIRPQSQQEEEHGGEECITAQDGNTVIVNSRVGHSESEFYYDSVFGSYAAQAEVYDGAAKPIVDSVLEGFNGTVFAYGQTGSGKTYTMEGEFLEDEASHGVIPRMVHSIFDGIFDADPNIEFFVKVSIVEIYNERIRDLLSRDKDNVKIREGANGVYLEEVMEKYVTSEAEIFQAMRTGKFNRTVAETSMNEHSSRSHLLFLLTVEQSDSATGTVKVGRLNLVDLAGSEKVSKSEVTGIRLDEAKNINKSLSALGNVINALTDKRSNHIPYRDSKLTRLLQDALGGNSKTCLIITVSPSSYNEVETISTLRFGTRAKMIQNKAKVNEERSVDELKALIVKTQRLVDEQRSRVSQLEERLRNDGIPIPPWDTQGPADAQTQQETADVKAALQVARKERDEIRKEIARLRDEERASEKVNDSVERDALAYQRGELMDEVEQARTEVAALEADLKMVQREPKKSPVSERIQMLAQLTAELRKTAEQPLEARERATADGEDKAQDEDDREKMSLKDGDRPLKRKVSQLDKNLEQLTVMYHKLVYQNNQLRGENQVMEKRITKKDNKVTLLENNLREAKQKYEKLLNQCANLTTAMDVYQGTRRAGRRAMIRVPIRGGTRQAPSEEQPAGENEDEAR
jgi:kinesin family protein 5